MDKGNLGLLVGGIAGVGLAAVVGLGSIATGASALGGAYIGHELSSQYSVNYKYK